MSSWLKKSLAFSLTAVFMFLLSACGAGGIGGLSTTSTTLSGTVASGAAVVGTVNIKGAKGNTASGDINSDGAYSINVASLTAPYILFARGAVNGRTIKMYSVGMAVGNVNITPITDLIVANALGGDPSNGFTDWSASSASKISTAVLKKAKDKVRTKLKPILDAAGVRASDDLLTAKFTANHTKMDAALDALDISFDPATKKATIKNRFDAGVKITDDVTNSADTAPIPFTPTQIADVKNKMKDMSPLNSLFKTFSDLFATSKPTAKQMDAAWLRVAADFLEDGLNKAQTKTAWRAGGDQGPSIGMKMSVSVIRDMTTAELKGTAYSKGLMVNINFVAPGESGTFPTFVVFDKPNNRWLWFGNRQWVGVDIKANAHMQIDSNGTVTFKTGWELHIDDMQKFALGKGVKSAIVTGPGMPAAGLIMDRNSPKDYFSIPASPSTGSRYWVSDTELAKVIENSVYTVKLYAETPSAVSLSNTALQIITVKVPSKPLLTTELKKALFWTLNAPTSHTLVTAVSIPGSLKVRWTNPATGTAKVRGTQLGWQETVSKAQNSVKKKISKTGQTSITLDTSSFASSVPSSAWLRMWGENADGLRFTTNWQFQ